MTRLATRTGLVRLALAAAALATFSGPAWSADDCGDRADQAGMNQCYGEVLKRADTRLQRTYDSLRADLSPDGRQRLLAAQRAWIAYRDAWCRFETAGVAGGSLYPTVLAQCLARLSDEQTAKLAEQANCSDDPACARMAD